MKSTTIKVSADTRDRLRALGGPTYEATILEALDVLEADGFWTQADAAAEWRDSLSADERARRDAHAAEIDAAFDGVG